MNTGVILAAGAGVRLGSLGQIYRKPLLPVGPRPLIAQHLDLFAGMGLTRVIVVVDAPESPVVEAARAAASPGVELIVALQAGRGGVGHAVLAAAPHAEGAPFVLVLGDTWLHPARPREGLAPLLAGAADAVLSIRLCHDAARIRRECSVVLDPAGRVKRIVEKPAQPLSPWKPCGLYFFGPAMWDALRHTAPSSLRGEIELTDAIQGLVARGGRVYTAQTLLDDVNITTPADYREACLSWLERQGLDRWHALDAALGPGVALDATLVLAGAQVGEGARLTRTVVLPGARVAAGARLEDVVVDAVLGVVPA